MSNEKFKATATISSIRWIIGYYILLTLISLIVIVLILMIDNDSGLIPSAKFINKNNLALLGSIFASIIGSSIGYVKKIYKFLIGHNFNVVINCDNEILSSMGTKLYFYMRPVFSMVFSILIILGIKGGVFILSGASLDKNSNLVEVLMFINFFVGLSTGNFLSYLENKSQKIIESLTNNKSN